MTMNEINNLTELAARYAQNAPASVVRNRHMNKYRGSEPDPELVKAMLVDFINFVAGQIGLDLGLYTCDLDGPAPTGREPRTIPDKIEPKIYNALMAVTDPNAVDIEGDETTANVPTHRKHILLNELQVTQGLTIECVQPRNNSVTYCFKDEKHTLTVHYYLEKER